MGPAERGAGGERIPVQVCIAAPPGQVLSIPLELAPGATVADALRAAGVASRLPAEVIDALSPSVWGRACRLDQPLRARDRIELTRALTVDPKEARRLRYRRDGVRRRAPAR